MIGRRRLRHALVAGAVVVGIGWVATVATPLWREHDEAVESASLKTQNLARVLEEHARQTLYRGELTLQLAAAALADRGSPGPATATDTRQRLRALLPVDGLIADFVRLDHHGTIVLSTAVEDTTGLPALADHDFFIAHRERTGLGMVIGATVRSRVTGEWIIPLSLRLDSAGGDFDGVLQATLAPGYFQRFYDSIDTGSQGFVTLFSRSGWILARAPFNDQIFGRNWADSPMFRDHLPSAAAKTVRQVVVADGIERIYSYRALKDYPVLVSLGLSLSESLAPWRRDLWRQGLLACLVLGALGALTWALLRQLRQTEALDNEQRAEHESIRVTLRAASQALVAQAGAQQPMQPLPPGRPDEVGALIGGFNQVLAALASRETVLRSRDEALKSISQGVVISGPDQLITSINDAFAAITGYSQAELIGRNCNLLQGPATDPAALAAIRQALHTQTRFDGEILNYRKDGSSFWNELTITPVFDAQGALAQFIGVTRDISAGKRMQQELQAQRDFATQIINSVGQGLTVTDAQGRFEYVNPAYARLIGCAPGDLIGKNPKEVTAPEDRAAQDVQRALRQAGQTSTYESLLSQPDGHLAPVSVTAVPRWRDGQYAGSIAVTTDLTERKLAEEQLRQSQESLRITLNSIGNAVIATDVAGRVTRMNPVAERLTGWPLADAMGQPLTAVFNIISAETRLPSANPVQLVMEHGQVVGLANHTALIARGGQEYQIADSAAPIRDATDAIVGVVLVFSNVTEKYLAEEAALRVSEHALQSVSQGVIISGSDQLIISANASFAAITGYTEAEVLGRNCKFLQGPDTDPVTVAAIRTALHRPAEFVGEILNYRKDGTAFWNDLTISPVLDAQGALTHFIGITRDITERKLTEEKLRETQSFLATLLEVAPVSIYTLALDNRFNLVNRQWEQDTQVASEKAIGRSLEDVFPAGLAHKYEADNLQVLQNNSILTFEEWAETSNGMRCYYTFKFPLHNAQGVIENIGGISLDITERKRAEQALQATLRDKEALLNEVHHRVKNNLQVVTSLLRLEAGRSSHAPTQTVLGDMQERIRSMALLHELIYRAGSFAAIDLGSYVGEVATQAFRSLHGAAGSGVRLRLDLGSVQVGLDQATPCGLLLTELLSNALKHGFGDGRSGEVLVELRPVAGDLPDRWCLRVSDTGVGLPGDFATRQQDSLGLQLVSNLATQMGGSLQVGAAPAPADGAATAPGAASAGASFAVTFAVLAPTA